MNAALGFSLLCLLSSDQATSAAVANLSSPSFRCREAASAALSSGMPEVRLLVLIAATHATDIEARSRASRILREWKPSLVYQWRWWLYVWPANGRWPHFDMIDSRSRFPNMLTPECRVPDQLGFSGRDTLFHAYFNQPTTHLCGPDFWAFRTASFRYCADLMRAGLQPEEVRLWLEEMRLLEVQWYWLYQQNAEP